jgi:hypothetical protein
LATDKPGRHSVAGRMPDADVTPAIKHAPIDKDTIGGDQIFDQLQVDRSAWSRHFLRGSDACDLLGPQALSRAKSLARCDEDAAC